MDIKEILKLPPMKRIVLAQEIWDSISSEAIVLTDGIKNELDRRLERKAKGETKYYTLEE